MNCVSILYLYSHTLVRTQDLNGPSLRTVHSLLSCLVFVQLARHTFRGADKQHVCACGILMSLCDLMRLMFLMFLYIAVLPHIFNILLRSIFVYVRKSFYFSKCFIESLTSTSSVCIHMWLKLAFCCSILRLAQLGRSPTNVVMVNKRKADQEGGAERSRPIHRVEGS